jgi:CubicO group peptidase (beta-lactamase class C family)
LKGLDNPLIYGGAISNLQDMAKLLLLHLRDGKCGDSHVLSEALVAAMRVVRTGTLMVPQDWGYGLGWCITQTPTYLEIGAFGSVVWLDIERGIGGFMAIDEYPADPLPAAAPVTWLAEIIPLHMNLKTSVKEASLTPLQRQSHQTISLLAQVKP